MTIAERVVKNGSASIEELVELTGVSAMTVYRDIEALEEAGVLLRHRGQVTAVATGLNEWLGRLEASFARGGFDVALGETLSVRPRQAHVFTVQP